MNNFRLLTRVLAVTLLSGGACAYAEAVQTMTLEELFQTAESNSAQLRPWFTAEEEADRGVDVARSKWLPDISANLSLSYIGDGFTTDRNFSDYQKAPIPHLGNGVGLGVEQSLYTGGAITAGIEMAKLKSSAARFTTEQQRDNIRFRLAGFYFDLYKYTNLRGVVEQNIAHARKVLDEMHARHEQGVALYNDITRYELLVSNLELQLVKIDNTLKILNRNLVVTAGLPDDTEIAPDTTILARALPSAGEGWWKQEALANSPSLKLARIGADISRSAEKLVKSEYLPKIGIKAAWTIDGPILVEVPPHKPQSQLLVCGSRGKLQSFLAFQEQQVAEQEPCGRTYGHRARRCCRRKRKSAGARRLCTLSGGLRGTKDPAEERGTCRAQLSHRFYTIFSRYGADYRHD